jgi:hypothetical protein
MDNYEEELQLALALSLDSCRVAQEAFSESETDVSIHELEFSCEDREEADSATLQQLRDSGPHSYLSLEHNPVSLAQSLQREEAVRS